jgi:hypothetical protein
MPVCTTGYNFFFAVYFKHAVMSNLSAGSILLNHSLQSTRECVSFGVGSVRLRVGDKMPRRSI